MTKLIVILFILIGNLACEERHPFRESPVQTPEEIDAPQKPTVVGVDQKWPEQLFMEYISSSAEDAAKVDTVCPEPPEFQIGGACTNRLQFCKRGGTHVYQCKPRVIRISGKVIDADTKQPIVGARVVGYMMMMGELGPATFTDKDGDYMLNQGSFCPHFALIHADQYHWGLYGWLFAHGAIRCKFDDTWASAGTVVEMKRLPRTLANDGQINLDNSCHFSGYVKDDDGKPLADVTVRCGDGEPMLTNSHGIYSFHDDQKTCPLVCSASKVGYKGKVHGITNFVAAPRGAPADMILVKE